MFYVRDTPNRMRNTQQVSTIAIGEFVDANDLTHKGYLWMMGILNQELFPLVASVKKYGLVPRAGNQPEKGELDIPFYSQKMLERVLKEQAE